jgi:hypothetical protein
MILLEFSWSPLRKGDSVGQYVARFLDIIDKSGVDYRPHAMGRRVPGARVWRARGAGRVRQDDSRGKLGRGVRRGPPML